MTPVLCRVTLGYRMYLGYTHNPPDCDSSDTGQGVTSDDSQDAMRIFATSPLDREHHRARADSDSGSVTSQERFKIGAFAGGDTKDNLPSLEEELAGEPLLQLLPRPRPNSAISVTSGETVSNTSATTDTDTQFLMSSDSGSKVQLADSRDAKGARPSAGVSVPCKVIRQAPRCKWYYSSDTQIPIPG